MLDVVFLTPAAFDASVASPNVSTSAIRSGGQVYTVNAGSVDVDAAISGALLRVELARVLTSTGVSNRLQSSPWAYEWDSASRAFTAAVNRCFLLALFDQLCRVMAAWNFMPLRLTDWSP